VSANRLLKAAKSKLMKAILEHIACEANVGEANVGEANACEANVGEANVGEELEAKHPDLDCSSAMVVSTPKLCLTALKLRSKPSFAGERGRARASAGERGRVGVEVAILSDGWRGYNGLVDVGYAKHFRVDHGANEFALGNRHINGIESFWSFAKRRLQKFNGVPDHMFYLHLKECEWRFNHRQNDLYKELLKLLRTNPI
jgi:transposase-like protein